MKVTRGYKTELDLNNAQVTACLKHAGSARYAYNWGLARCEEEYKAGRKTPSAMSLHKELNALKQTELPWMYEVSKCAPQEALRDLEQAFKHFFRKCRLKRRYMRVLLFIPFPDGNRQARPAHGVDGLMKTYSFRIASFIAKNAGM